MANLIYSIPTSNNGEQYKDNNNNITKYLELNKGYPIGFGRKDLDKETTSHDDLFDAFRLSLRFWH